MTNRFFQVRERFQTKNKFFTSTSIIIKTPTSLLKIDKCFQFLSFEICSMIKTHVYQIAIMISTFFKKLEPAQKMICGITNDDAKQHTVKEKNRKKRTNKGVYFNYETDQKPVHFKNEYDEISSTNEIIFFRGYDTAKKKESTAIDICAENELILKTGNRQIKKWIKKKQIGKYEIVLNMHLEKIPEIQGSSNEITTKAILKDLISKNDDGISHAISKADIQKLLNDEKSPKKKKKKKMNDIKKKKTENKDLSKPTYEFSSYEKNAQRNVKIAKQVIIQFETISQIKNPISQIKNPQEDVQKNKTAFFRFDVKRNQKMYDAYVKKRDDDMKRSLLTVKLPFDINLSAIPHISTYKAFDKVMNTNHETIMKGLQNDEVEKDQTKSHLNEKVKSQQDFENNSIDDVK